MTWLAFLIMEALGQKVNFKGAVLDHFEMITIAKARGGTRSEFTVVNGIERARGFELLRGSELGRVVGNARW